MINEQTQEIFIEHNNPTEEFSKIVENYAINFGDQTLETAYQLRIIEKNLIEATRPHIQLQLIHAFLRVVSTKDPTYFHFDIARLTLTKIAPDALKNEHAIDMLSREFLKACHALLRRIKLPPHLASCIKSVDAIADEITGHTSCIQIATFPKANSDFEEQFFKREIRIWDYAYLKYFKTIGPQGRKTASELLEKMQKHCDLSFWFRQPNQSVNAQYFHSEAFVYLAVILWHDIIKGRLHFQKHQVPALSTNVYLNTAKLLNPKTLVVQQEKSIQLIADSEVLGLINIPTVPANLLHAVFKGLPKLHSVYGHRLFRFEVQEPFKKKNSGDPDFRVIKLDGGKSELAERLGFKGKKAITVLGEILHAQAYLEFKSKDSAGNLIQLTKYLSPTTKRDEGLLITVGTMLLPYHVFEEGGLLIPLLKDPPLIGANQYQASLFSLQMDVMAEMSKHSMDLFTQGTIWMPKQHWDELCLKNGIPISFGQQVLARWIQDGDDTGKFLECVDKEHYTLGSEYSKELAFLIEQGKRRKQGSIAGIQSSRAKKQGSRAKR